jgi:hypothetical protein
MCDALAARFAPGTISTPTGASAMRKAYSEAPKNIPAVPAVFLEVKDGDIVANPGQWKFEHNVDVVFLLSKRPGDPARVETQRRYWLPILWAATQGQLKLGYGGASGYSLDKAIPTGWEFTEEAVAGDLYDGIRLHWILYVTETVALTA